MESYTVFPCWRSQHCCAGSLQDHPQVWWSIRRARPARLQSHSRDYYTTGYKAKSTKGRADGVESGGLQVWAPRSLSQDPPSDELDSSSNRRWPGKLIKDSVPRVFTGGWSRRHPLPSTHQNPRLPEGKQVSRPLKHRKLLSSVLRIMGSMPNSKFPDISQGPTWQVGFSKDSSPRPAVLTLSAQS